MAAAVKTTGEVIDYADIIEYCPEEEDVDLVTSTIAHFSNRKLAPELLDHEGDSCHIPPYKTIYFRDADNNLRPKEYRCRRCSYIETSARRMRFHCGTVHDGWQTVCLKREREVEEPGTRQIIYACDICFRQYSLVEDLRGHMLEYHKCTVPQISKENANPEKIAKPVVPPIQAAKKLFVVPKAAPLAACNAFEPEMRPMPFKDFRLVLRAKLTLRCAILGCVYKFENSAKMRIHSKCHMNVAGRNQFKCFVCGSMVENWRQCAAHLWKAHQLDADLLQCPICEFKAHASVLVWRHMRVHKKWRPRVMRTLRAVQKRREQNLQKLNEPKPPLMPCKKNKFYAEKTCAICSRKFVNGKTLSKHVKSVHNKIKPFICNVCGIKTARKSCLIIHMRQHTGEKPLQCKTCKFSTRDPSVLQKHQLRHEKAGKFTCTVCGYTCIQTNSYKRHMRLKHPEEYKKIACDLCSFVTITELKLQAHKEDHLKGLVVNTEDSMDATRSGGFKNPGKLHDKNNEISADCFLPLESIDSMPHEPAVDTGGVTIPAPSEDTQFPTYLNN